MLSFTKQLKIKIKSRNKGAKMNMESPKINSWCDDDSSTDSTTSSSIVSSQEISNHLMMRSEDTIFSPQQPDDSKYGYEEAVPDNAQAAICDDGDMGKYGYGYASPDNKYGYGEPAPDAKYGYGDAAPDNKYGYGEAAPDKKYGYGDGAPDNKGDDTVSDKEMAKYGYGRGSPDMATCNMRKAPRRTSSFQKTPRRSSMKQNGTPRRASIQFGGEVQEYYLPGRNEPVKRRSSIQFNEGVRVKNVTPVSSLTDEPEKLWFQEDEYKQIRRRSIELIEKVESGKTRGKKYCTRGLEKMMTHRRNSLQQSKYELWDAVLDEQEFQRHEGTYDEDTISEAARYRTSGFRREAFQRGKQDAKEVEAYLSSTRRMCRRLSM